MLRRISIKRNCRRDDRLPRIRCSQM